MLALVENRETYFDSWETLNALNVRINGNSNEKVYHDELVQRKVVYSFERRSRQRMLGPMDRDPKQLCYIPEPFFGSAIIKVSLKVI